MTEYVTGTEGASRQAMPTFKVVFRGYDREAVDAYLQRSVPCVDPSAHGAQPGVGQESAWPGEQTAAKTAINTEAPVEKSGADGVAAGGDEPTSSGDETDLHRGSAAQRDQHHMVRHQLSQPPAAQPTQGTPGAAQHAELEATSSAQQDLRERFTQGGSESVHRVGVEGTENVAFGGGNAAGHHRCTCTDASPGREKTAAMRGAGLSDPPQLRSGRAQLTPGAADRDRAELKSELAQYRADKTGAVRQELRQLMSDIADLQRRRLVLQGDIDALSEKANLEADRVVSSARTKATAIVSEAQQRALEMMAAPQMSEAAREAFHAEHAKNMLMLEEVLRAFNGR